jgi:hypothetical protein
MDYEYEERAAIKEFDAFIPRNKAETEAAIEIAKEKYLTKNTIKQHNID